MGQESGAQIEETVKKPEINEDDDDSPPLPPWQIGCENQDLANKKSYVTSSTPPSVSDCQPCTPFTSDVVVPPSTSHQVNEQNMPSSVQPQVEIVIHRPPPPSMLRQSDDDEEEDPSVAPSLPILEATLVEDPPVYDAIAVRSDANQGDSGAQENGDKANIDQHAISWWKRNQKYLLVGVIALVFGGLIATVATLVGSKDDINIVVPTLPPTVPINDSPYNTTTSATLPSNTTSPTTFTTTTRTTLTTVS